METRHCSWPADRVAHSKGGPYTTERHARSLAEKQQKATEGFKLGAGFVSHFRTSNLETVV